MAVSPNQEIAQRNRMSVVEAIRRHGPLSRKELADLLGLSPSTLTRIASQVVESGIVVERPVFDLRRGQPRARLEINPEWGHVLAVSITHQLHVGVVNVAGALVHSEQTLAGRVDHGALCEHLRESVLRLLDEWVDANLVGIGVLSASYVDKQGIVRDPERGALDLRGTIAEATDLPVSVGEEYRLLLLAKLRDMPSSPWEHVVALAPGPLGAGGGHALYTNGGIYYGRNGMAGLPGCFFGAPYTHDVGKEMLREIEAMGGMPSFMRFVERERPEALAVYAKVVENYGHRLAQVVGILNPDACLLYTPYATLGQSFLDRVIEAAREHMPAVCFDGMELLFGGERTDEERLLAAAAPVLSDVLEGNIFECAAAEMAVGA